jgi:hypothetical protein
MSSLSHLHSILYSPLPLRSISQIRIRLNKNSPRATEDANVRAFIRHKLPILRYSNPSSLKVEIVKLHNKNKDNNQAIAKSSQPSSSLALRTSGIEITYKGQPYVMNYRNLRDDQMLEALISLDKGDIDRDLEAKKEEKEAQKDKKSLPFSKGILLSLESLQYGEPKKAEAKKA